MNAAEVGELSPNTGRAPADSEMPGFHHADGKGLQLAVAHCKGWAVLLKAQRMTL